MPTDCRGRTSASTSPVRSAGDDRGRGAMSDDAPSTVSASRRIDAPAQDIFHVLSDPERHPEIDGSGMLRPGADNGTIAGEGDVFDMKMHHPAMGDYDIHNRVLAYDSDRSIGWEPGNGSRWRFDLVPDGPGATVVTETYDCSAASDEVRQAVD